MDPPSPRPDLPWLPPGTLRSCLNLLLARERKELHREVVGHGRTHGTGAGSAVATGGDLTGRRRRERAREREGGRRGAEVRRRNESDGCAGWE
jgi:hypothetical protein